MPYEPTQIRYASGDVALVGDRVDDDGWESVVDDVIATPERMEFWGLKEPGLMLKCEEAGLVFKPCSSVGWNVIRFERRAVGA